VGVNPSSIYSPKYEGKSTTSKVTRDINALKRIWELAGSIIPFKGRWMMRHKVLMANHMA
jgi:hypothetical protein